MLEIPNSSYKKMPWKNGLGFTMEIDRSPIGEGAYLWRLSQATIQTDSAFSQFPGYDRWLVVWRGHAIFLNDQKLEPLQPVRFSGDEKTFCRLSGAPVLDVGLIFDRSKVDAKMSVVAGEITLPADGVHYVFDLNSGDTIKFEQAADVTVEKSLLVTVSLKT